MPKKTEKVILCCLSFFASRPGAATSHYAFSGTVSVLNGIVKVDMTQKCVALCIDTHFVCVCHSSRGPYVRAVHAMMVAED